MLRAFPFLAVVTIAAGSATAIAGSVGTYSGCKSLKGERAACEKCVAGGNFYQPGGTCGMAEGMHKSKAAATEKPPPRPKAMPKAGKEYVTIKPAPFEIGARRLDADKDEDKELFGVTVTLTHPFMMKTTEVTQGEWLFVVGSVNSSYDKACGLECPVGAVSWRDTLDYLNLLSKQEKLEPCYTFKGGGVQWPKGLECTGYRLPTEAEWEYAARGGKEEPRYDDDLDAIAWYSDNSNGTAHPVGKKKKNAYGLYDMLGNAWEWTWDLEEIKPFPEDVTDPINGGLTFVMEGQSRIIRGGSYDDGPRYQRATHRFQIPATSGSNHHGFRPVRTVPSP